MLLVLGSCQVVKLIYLELDREDDFFTFDVEVDSGYGSCGEGDDGAFLCAEDDCGDDKL